MEQDIILASQSWITAGGLLLICIGVMLCIGEIFIPSYGLFGFLGATCLSIGLIQLHQSDVFHMNEAYYRIANNIAGVAVLLSGFAIWQTSKLYRKRNTTGVEAMIGETAFVIIWCGKKAGTSGRIRVPGEDWRAFTETPVVLQPGAKVVVQEIVGLRIKVTPYIEPESDEDSDTESKSEE